MEATGSPALMQSLLEGDVGLDVIGEVRATTSRQAVHCPWSCAMWQPWVRGPKKWNLHGLVPLGSFGSACPEKVCPGLRSDMGTKQQALLCWDV